MHISRAVYNLGTVAIYQNIVSSKYCFNFFWTNCKIIDINNTIELFQIWNNNLYIFNKTNIKDYLSTD